MADPSLDLPILPLHYSMVISGPLLFRSRSWSQITAVLLTVPTVVSYTLLFQAWPLGVILIFQNHPPCYMLSDSSLPRCQPCMHFTASTSALCLSMHVSLISPLLCSLCMLFHTAPPDFTLPGIVTPTGLYPPWFCHPLVVLCLLLDMTSSIRLHPIHVVAFAVCTASDTASLLPPLHRLVSSFQDSTPIFVVCTVLPSVPSSSYCYCCPSALA
jgi:hypothetical protein